MRIMGETPDLTTMQSTPQLTNEVGSAEGMTTQHPLKLVNNTFRGIDLDRSFPDRLVFYEEFLDDFDIVREVLLPEEGDLAFRAFCNELIDYEFGIEEILFEKCQKYKKILKIFKNKKIFPFSNSNPGYPLVRKFILDQHLRAFLSSCSMGRYWNCCINHGIAQNINFVDDDFAGQYEFNDLDYESFMRACFNNEHYLECADCLSLHTSAALHLFGSVVEQQMNFDPPKSCSRKVGQKLQTNKKTPPKPKIIDTNKVKQKQLDKLRDLSRQLKWEPQMFTGIASLPKVYGDLTSAVSNINAVVDNFKNLATPEMAQRVSTCVEDISSITGRAKQQMDSESIHKALEAPSVFAQAFKSISEVLSDTKEALAATTLWLSIGFGLYGVAEKKKKYVGMAAIAGLFSFFMSGGSQHVVAWLQAVVKDDKVEPQICVEDLRSVSAVAVAGLATLVGISDKKVNISKCFIDFLEKRDRLTNSLSGILQAILLFLEEMVNKCATIFGNFKLFKFLTTSKTEIDDYIDKVEAFRSDVDHDKVFFTQSCYDRLIALFNEGEKLIKSVPRGPDSSQILQVLRHRMLWLDKKRTDFANSSFNMDGTRPEPVFILLRGEPGMGKSMLLDFLHNAICSRTIPSEMRGEFEKFPSKFMYERHVESEYWDRYDHYKWITLFDDLGQIRDVVGNADNEWLNLIRACNSFPYPLHMAALEDKGKTYFQSKFVIATTNLKEFKPESIVSVEAVNRRIDFELEVTPNPDYCSSTETKSGGLKWRLDKDRMPVNEDGKSVFTENVPNLSLKRGGLYYPVTFSDLVDMVVSEYKIKVDRYNAQAAELKRVRNAQYSIREKSEALQMDEVESTCEPQMDTPDLISPMGLVVNIHDLFMSFGRLNPRYYNNKIITEFMNRLVLAWFDGSIQKQRFWDILSIVYPDIVDDCLPGGLPMHAVFAFCNEYSEDSVRLFFDSSHVEWCEQMDRFGAIDFQSMPLKCGIAYCKEKLDRVARSMWKDVGTFSRTQGGKLLNWISRSGHIIVIIGALSSIGTLLGLRAFTSWLHNDKPLIKYEDISTLGWEEAARKAAEEYAKEKELANEFSEPQSFGPDDRMKVGRPGDAMRARARLRAGIKVSPQMASSYDSSTYRRCDSVVQNNMYEFRMQNVDRDMKRAGFITFIKGRIAMMPAHFMNTIGRNCVEHPECLDWRIRLIKCEIGEEPTDLTFSRFIQLPCEICEDQDVCLVDFSGLVREHRDIMNMFISETILDKLEKPQLLIPGPGDPRCDHTECGDIIHRLPVETPQGRKYTLSTVLWYRGPFTVGDCGRPVFVMHRNSSWGVIAGIHTAGMTNVARGAASVTTLEMMEALVEALEMEKLGGICEQQMLPSEVPPRFKVLEVVQEPVLIPTKTRIIRSGLYGMWTEPLMAPSRLRPFVHEGMVIDPFQNALAKYCINTVELPLSKLELCSINYGDWIESVSTPGTARIFDFQTAVCGIPGHRYFTSINRSSSPGYPFIHNPLYKGKGSFGIFGSGQEFDLETSACLDLKIRVDSLIDNAKKGIRETIVFTDNLKDERRPKEKVIAGKTRLFSGCPKHYLIASRQYFGAFQEWFLENNTINGSAIGLNPYSAEWDRLSQLLVQKGGSGANYGAGDYSAFDGSERSEVHWLIFDIIDRWYIRRGDSQINSAIRRVLWQDLVSSKHIRENVIYEWKGSLPSGHPMTTIVNTIYNQINFRYCWGRMYEDGGQSFQSGLANFSREIFVVGLGDDNAYSVIDAYSDVFTEVNVSSWMKELGMVYTSETKDVINQALRHLDDIEFLKRSFIYDKEYCRWLAPLRLSVILEMPYWTKKLPGQIEEIVAANVQVALDELSLHSKDVFREWALKIVSSYRRVYGRAPERQTFTNCRSFALQQDLFW